MAASFALLCVLQWPQQTHAESDYTDIWRGCFASFPRVKHHVVGHNDTWGTRRAAAFLDHLDSWKGPFQPHAEYFDLVTRQRFSHNRFAAEDVFARTLRLCPLAAIVAHLFASDALGVAGLWLRGLALVPAARQAQGVAEEDRERWGRGWASAISMYWPKLAAMAPGRIAAAFVQTIPGCSGRGLAGLDWAGLLGARAPIIDLGCESPIDVMPASASFDWSVFRSRVESRPRLPLHAGTNGHEYVLQGQVPVWGLWLEFGVGEGKSLQRLASRPAGGETVYGFDWFKGLPEPWVMFDRGAFGTDGGYPSDLPSNAELVVGLFNESLPAFVQGMRTDASGREQPLPRIQVLNFDCDLYLCHKDIFQELQVSLVPGSILVFDDIFNFPHYEQEALRAFVEFVSDPPRAFRVLAAPWEVIWDVPAVLCPDIPDHVDPETYKFCRWQPLFWGAEGQRFLAIELLDVLLDD